MKIVKFILIGIIVIIIAGAGLYVGINKKEVGAPTYTVSKGEIEKYVEETATVKSDNQRKIYSKGSAEILELSVEVGDKVNEGDVIARLDTENIELQIKTLEAKLKALQATYREAVKLPEEELINKAEANVRSAKIAVDEAKRNAEKSEKLYKEGAISSDEYQRALDNLKIQQESLTIAENELQALKKGPSDNIRKQYQAQIEELKYQLNQLKKTKQDYLIKSPVDGVVLERFVEVGGFVQPGMAIVEVGNIDKLYVETDILVSEIGDVKVGDLSFVYSEDLSLQNLKGKVRKIYPKAFSKLSDLGIEQKRVKVEIDLEESTEKLRVGYEVDVKIITDKKEDVIVIPDTAVVEFEDGKYVNVVKNDTTEQRKIEVGIEGEDKVEVIAGLKEGEEIIIK
ncbi:efflux RND transporter periplasmic adaptor subunit [Caldisalinibacter kiritimatiensis]|uniref:Secretion protein HlyD n=1 Tax=Caldisalinibacter kiritimatiensis TaxID=1304284 RepID=R1ASE4_9FIRM|nr:efflux RND transporter periplasmic adaptor subunit [Caldisalinibacter kiritimatiensis]EOC99571.1 Secretion protein HlyD [Caldisalinibacter kiritimatiensis]